MATCEPAWTPLFMVTLLMVVPLGLPLLGLALHAWRRDARWASVAGSVVALVGFVAMLLVIRSHSGDPRWWPLLFLPPLALCAAAALSPGRRLRVAAFAASLVPTLGLWAFGVRSWLADAGTPCPG